MWDMFMFLAYIAATRSGLLTSRPTQNLYTFFASIFSVLIVGGNSVEFFRMDSNMVKCVCVALVLVVESMIELPKNIWECPHMLKNKPTLCIKVSRTLGMRTKYALYVFTSSHFPNQVMMHRKMQNMFLYKIQKKHIQVWNDLRLSKWWQITFLGEVFL